MNGFSCTDVVDRAPACARTLDVQKARGALDNGPSDDAREFCPAGRDLPVYELDPPLLKKLHSIGALDESDELCCYSACVPLDVVPPSSTARGGNITLCIGAPESTSLPSPTYAECPAALRSRVFHDVGVLDVPLTKAERAGTSKSRLSSRASERPCCYEFARKVEISPP